MLGRQRRDLQSDAHGPINNAGAPPQDFGLDIDGYVLHSHCLTCAPVRVRRTVVSNPDFSGDLTILWVGYPDDEVRLHEHEAWAEPGRTRQYSYTHNWSKPLRIASGPTVYDMIAYPSVKDYRPRRHNFHPD